MPFRFLGWLISENRNLSSRTKTISRNANSRRKQLVPPSPIARTLGKGSSQKRQLWARNQKTSVMRKRPSLRHLFNWTTKATKKRKKTSTKINIDWYTHPSETRKHTTKSSSITAKNAMSNSPARTQRRKWKLQKQSRIRPRSVSSQPNQWAAHRSSIAPRTTATSNSLSKGGNIW